MSAGCKSIDETMKLPKSKTHFVYSDQNGVIYFIHSDATKSITKFHNSLNNKGHITVNTSKRSKATRQENIGFECHCYHVNF